LSITILAEYILTTGVHEGDRRNRVVIQSFY